MKNFKLLLLTLLIGTAGLTACRKDKQDAPRVDTPAMIEAKAKVLGKWYIKQVVFTYYTSGTQTNKEVFTQFDETQFYNFTSGSDVYISHAKKIGNYTYNFTDDGKTFSTNSANDTYSVKSVNETDMVLFKEHVPQGTARVTEEITLSKTR